MVILSFVSASSWEARHGSSACSDHPEAGRAKLKRFPLQRAVAFHARKPRVLKYAQQLPVSINLIDRLFAFRLAVANECVRRGQPRRGRLVARLVQEIQITELVPTPVQRLREQALRHEVRFQHELAARLQDPMNRPEELPIAGLLEVAEAVPEAEGV